MTDPTIPELVARLRELHAKLQALQVGTPELTAARQLFRDVLQLSAPAILDALDHLGDANKMVGRLPAAGEPGLLSSDGVCTFCNCYTDTSHTWRDCAHTWRDCAHDLRETAQGLAERAERVTRDSVAAISRVRGRLAEFRLRVSEAAGCTRVVTDVTPEPFTVAASDDVALGAIRDLKERSTWRPIEECGELEDGWYDVWVVKPEYDGGAGQLMHARRFPSGEFVVAGLIYEAQHITHVHEMGPIRGPGEG